MDRSYLNQGIVISTLMDDDQNRKILMEPESCLNTRRYKVPGGEVIVDGSVHWIRYHIEDCSLYPFNGKVRKVLAGNDQDATLDATLADKSLFVSYVASPADDTRMSAFVSGIEDMSFRPSSTSTPKSSPKKINAVRDSLKKVALSTPEMKRLKEEADQHFQLAMDKYQQLRDGML